MQEILLLNQSQMEGEILKENCMLRCLLICDGSQSAKCVTAHVGLSVSYVHLSTPIKQQRDARRTIDFLQPVRFPVDQLREI